MRAAKVLLLDVDPHAWGPATIALREEGMEVETGGGGEDRAAPHEWVFDVAIVNSDYLQRPYGVDIQQLRKWSPGAAIIVASEETRVSSAVSAIRNGAFDYICPPYSPSTVVQAVQRAWATIAEERISGVLGETVVSQQDFSQFIGESRVIQTVREHLQRVASTPSVPALICGERGVGKTLAAHLIHHNSQRASAPLVKLSLTGLSRTAIEERLFGSVQGWTRPTASRSLWEQADGGTAIIDDIEHLPPSLEGKMLQFLEDGRYLPLGGSQLSQANVRIIACTSTDLARLVKDGSFSADLYHHLRVLPIAIAPLRTRSSDVRGLLSHFLGRYNRRLGTRVWAVSPETVAQLNQYSWPGNVKELMLAVEAAVMHVREGTLQPEHFPQVTADLPNESGIALPSHGLDLEALERRFVIQALERTQGNRTHAAKLLGLNRDQMRYRVEKYGLRDWPFPPNGGSTDPPARRP